MNNNSGNHFFPFPVLGNKKSIASIFEFVKPIIKEAQSNINISGLLTCDNKTILSLCSEGSAEAYGHIECIRTSYRNAFKSSKFSGSSDTEFKCIIPSEFLRGSAELGFFVVTTKPIENYQPDRLDPLYGKSKFNLPARAILAVSKRLYLNIEDESIKSSNSSIFEWAKGCESKLVYWDFDRTSGKIGIMVPPEDLNTIRNLRTNELLVRTLIVSFVLPALAQALTLIFKADEFAWKTPLKAVIDKERVEITDQTTLDQTYKIAQKLLKSKDAQESIFSNLLQEILNPES
jgi:hypothetical protein